MLPGTGREHHRQIADPETAGQVVLDDQELARFHRTARELRRAAEASTSRELVRLLSVQRENEPSVQTEHEPREGIRDLAEEQAAEHQHALAHAERLHTLQDRVARPGDVFRPCGQAASEVLRPTPHGAQPTLDPEKITTQRRLHV